VSAGGTGLGGPAASLRLDKWLWYARFCKTRSLAARFCQSGSIRIAGSHVMKAHQPVRAGDVLTFPLGHAIRVVRVRALGARRGPAAEARTLYDDLTPSAVPASEPALIGEREPGSGRPTKRERREIDRLKGED
jgi:ribosome-associated heat shock protein Hsp15